MEPEGVKRKLTTILAADVEGYSRSSVQRIIEGPWHIVFAASPT